MSELEEFFKWADKSKAVTWAGKLGLKERWRNRDNPEYKKMLEKQHGEKK
jgi:hypothetical protein